MRRRLEWLAVAAGLSIWLSCASSAPTASPAPAAAPPAPTAAPAQEGLHGDPRALLDPNVLTADGTVAVTLKRTADGRETP